MNFTIFILVTAWLIQMIFLVSFAFIFKSLKQSINREININGNQINIVVCARNELQNLQKNLQFWVNQKSNQENCKLTIINDGSTDGSLIFLKNKAKEHTNLKVITVPNNIERKGKKTALSIGLQSIKEEYIILTDADCQPTSLEWASIMAKSLKKNDKKISLGFAPYFLRPKVVNYFVQYETTLTAMLYAGFALYGFPYMGVGRNMAYKKSFYDEVGGMSKLPKHLKSGDDDMFVNKHATAENTIVCFDEAALCYSEAPENFVDWLNQKKRHLSTSPNYKLKHKMLLSLYAITHFLFIGTIFVSIFMHSYYIIYGLYLIRILLLFVIFKKIVLNFCNLFTLFLVSIIDALHFFYYLTLSFYSFLRPKTYWK